MSGPETLHLTSTASRDGISFTLNDKIYRVSSAYDLTTSLNDYIRDGAGLRGTKVMCKEGGCGCCAVTVTKPDPNTGKDTSFSINSCLCPLYSVDGWSITTTEGLGNSRDGFHPIQKRIAEFNGTQCGYCTPGMVMNMYGLVHQKPALTKQDIDDNFDGNICRCTGYRPILDAMRTFAGTASAGLGFDIEDLSESRCDRTGKSCLGCVSNGSCNGGSKQTSNVGDGLDVFHVVRGDTEWYKPRSIRQLTLVLTNTSTSLAVRQLAGNTASGIYKHDGPFDTYVDLQNIQEFYKTETQRSSVTIGSNVTLSALIKTLADMASGPGYSYFTAVAAHLRKVGNVLVRNAGTWAGNLMVKHCHPEFPSDVFTLLEAVSARVHILDHGPGAEGDHSLKDFLQLEMAGKTITRLELFQLDPRARVQSFKVSPRLQNAHAYVNAAFCLTLDVHSQVVCRPSLVFGGISPDTIHASKTEDLLMGKCLTDRSLLQGILTYLHAELHPSQQQPLSASPEYRRQLGVNLFYKFLLSLRNGEKGDNSYCPLSTSQHTFENLQSEWPLKAPMPKLTAPLQASGEAVYVDDLPVMKNQLYGSFVLTSVAKGKVIDIDATKALNMPGVVRLFTAKDIPGENNALKQVSYPQQREELFCSGNVKHAGQQIGFLVAESQSLAEEASRQISVTYTDTETPILSVQDAIHNNSYHANPLKETRIGEPEDAMAASSSTVEGQCTMENLFHFYLENNAAVCVPSEDGLDVYTPTQALSGVQRAIAAVIGQPCNYVNVTVPRIGGSFGGKNIGTAPPCIAPALAAYKLNRPVRTTIGLASAMEMLGNRGSILAKYQAGFDGDGRLQAVTIDVYCDCGYTSNWVYNFLGILADIDGGYFCPNRRVRIILCKTNKPTSQSMRAPANYPAGFIIESVMEHVASFLQMDPEVVKEMNLYQEGQVSSLGNDMKYCTLRRLWAHLHETAEIERRKAVVEAFNKEHKWRKRGLAMTPVKFSVMYNNVGYTVDVAIYEVDGSVTVTQGGVEMGQGLYTKVAQAVASSLGIPVTTIKVRPNISHVSVNNFPTAGSSTSELAVNSALRCCEILKERMEPVRKNVPEGADWLTVIRACSKLGIELAAKHKWKPEWQGGAYSPAYCAFAAGASEVELDVLTGENHIRRVDIIYDCGESLNPVLDIGQIEGAFMMGVGGLLLERVVYDDVTGRVVNNSTWDYKPPTCKDIPVDWRISLLPDSPCPQGVRGSKAVGEPPIMLSTGVFFALKHAVGAARLDLTGDSKYQESAAPMTVERAHQGCGVVVDSLKL
ncbi:indole-3-acetaldehyde oxidase-like isoform X1 [Haliotis rufescens]|uniref:indole-3-acetaldehyde oxidase-like isoform X1 n=3 Tax=Haliotis rufescens TaxID=6454 RepID=UPI00201EEE2E|nr:indole-3-acetaldehyde oxidase-like isoform X1 [Haliotis rufescens]